MQIQRLIQKDFHKHAKEETIEPNTFTYHLDKMKKHLDSDSIEVPKFSTLGELEEWMKCLN